MLEDEPPHVVDLRRRMVDTGLDPLPAGRSHDDWRPVFERVPLHVFMPRISSVAGETLVGRRRPRPGSDWLEHVYFGAFVFLPDGHAPMSLCRLGIRDLAELFAHTGITEGQRVLVLGAGQGYVPALLCARLGDDRVTVTDPDARVLAGVVRRLHAAGYRPTAKVARAEDGYPANAPYDRVITNRTRDTLDIPAAWTAQVEAGGRVLVVLSSQHVIALDVRQDGTAEGRFPPEVSFKPPWMPPPWATREELADPCHERRPTTVTARVCDEFAVSGFKLHVRLDVGEIGSATSAMYGTYNTGFRHRDGSWANVDSNDRTTWEVTEGGPRMLWTEIETSYERWRGLGEPGHADYRLIVTPGSRTVAINGVDAALSGQPPR